MLLTQPISTAAARGAVEKWLLQVQDVMLISIRDVIEKARDVSNSVSNSCLCIYCVRVRLCMHVCM